MYICIYDEHPQVINSPLINDHFNIKDYRTGELIKTQTLIIQVPSREFYNHLIKPLPEGVFFVQDWNMVS